MDFTAHACANTHPPDRKVAERSMLIKNMIEDLGTPGDEPIPIMNVSRPHPIQPTPLCAPML